MSPSAAQQLTLPKRRGGWNPHLPDHSSPRFPSRGLDQFGPAKVDHSLAAPSMFTESPAARPLEPRFPWPGSGGRVSLAGRRTMSTAIKLREVAYPALFAAAA